MHEFKIFCFSLSSEEWLLRSSSPVTTSSDQARYQKVLSYDIFAFEQVYREGVVMRFYLYTTQFLYSVFIISRGLFGHRKEWRNVMSNALFIYIYILSQEYTVKEESFHLNYSFTHKLFYGLFFRLNSP